MNNQKQVLRASLLQMKRIDELNQKFRQLSIKYNRAFTTDPEDIVRILALINELHHSQLTLSTQISQLDN